MKKKKEDNIIKQDFNVDMKLKNVNRFLRPGFKDYIKDKSINNQKDFDKYLNEYKGVN